MSVLVSFFFGALLEIFLFCRYEWDRRAPRIVQGAFVLYCFAMLYLILRGFTLLGAIQQTYFHGTCALTGLFGSMVVYRIFFHRLRTFPGPLAARISAFWVIKQSIPDLRFFIKIRSLHDQYGDFVRISKWPAQRCRRS